MGWGTRALPLRHHLYPGNVDWHEEGYTMSWRRMLRAKSGRARFSVREPGTGAVRQIDLAPDLTRHQAARLPVRPDMIWRFARELKRGLDHAPTATLSRQSPVSGAGGMAHTAQNSASTLFLTPQLLERRKRLVSVGSVVKNPGLGAE